MKTSTLRRKRVVLPALAAVAVLAVGGTVWAASADDVSGDERDRVAAAATEAAGGGEAVEVEKADDPGEAYEVEVRLADGSEVDVTLDADLGVVTTDRDDDRDDDRADRDDRGEGGLLGGGTLGCGECAVVGVRPLPRVVVAVVAVV
ncbi:MAG TPA: hypothetical protein VM575_20375, partial [Nocardioides sp.]|nr:hypothetical protein [Nocardioides sp.]